jgi:hypothetical protein
LDKALDEKGIPGSDEFGDVLIGLDVNVPDKVLSSWKKIPADKNDPLYTNMSECVQKFLRRYIPYCYFQERKQFENLTAAYPLLVYSALPPLYKVKLKSGNQLFLIDGIVPEWEFQESPLRDEVLSQLCAPRLQEVILPRLQRQLQGMPNQLANYNTSLIGKMISLKQPLTKGFFEGLMFFEANLIGRIHKACQNLRKHLDTQDLEEAVESLAKFGESLTRAFHEDLNSVYTGSTLRSFGPLLFIEVTKVFDKKLADKIMPAAMLELIVLSKQSSFTLEDYFKGQKPVASEVALQQHIINLGTSDL